LNSLTVILYHQEKLGIIVLILLMQNEDVCPGKKYVQPTSTDTGYRRIQAWRDCSMELVKYANLQ
jgi:hypothetical protein